MFIGALARALEADWFQISYEIGLWIPVEVVHEEHDDKPEGAEFGNDISYFSVFTMLPVQTKNREYCKRREWSER